MNWSLVFIVNVTPGYNDNKYLGGFLSFIWISSHYRVFTILADDNYQINNNIF